MYIIIDKKTNNKVENTREYKSLTYATSILSDLIFNVLPDDMNEYERKYLVKKELEKYELREIEDE